MSESSALLRSPQKEDSYKPWYRGSAWAVGIYSMGLLVTGVGNSIFFKKMTNHMPNYPFYLSQVINVVYIPIFFGLVEYEKRFTRFITEEMEAFPKVNFLLMGTADAVAGLVMLFGGVHTSGSRQALFNNTVIPFTMLLSVVLIRARFHRWQYIGALTITCGVVVVLAPDLLGSLSPSTVPNPQDSSDMMPFNLLYLSSAVPQAFSSVWKEIALQGIEMDVNYLQAWVALYQLIVGFLLIPTNCLKFLGPNYIPFDAMFTSLVNGWWCMLGVDAVTTYCIEPSTGNVVGGVDWSPTLPLCDHCAGAWVPMTLYLLFNIFQSVFVVLVIKHGNASLMFAISTLRLPLIQLAFTLRVVNDPPDAFAWSTLAGLVITLVGLAVYRYPTVAEAVVVGEEEVPSHAGAAAAHSLNAGHSDSHSDGDGSSGSSKGVAYAHEGPRSRRQSFGSGDNPEESINVFGGGGSGSGQIDITVALKRLNPDHFSPKPTSHHHGAYPALYDAVSGEEDDDDDVDHHRPRDVEARTTIKQTAKPAASIAPVVLIASSKKQQPLVRQLPNQ